MEGIVVCQLYNVETNKATGDQERGFLSTDSVPQASWISLIGLI